MKISTSRISTFAFAFAIAQASADFESKGPRKDVHQAMVTVLVNTTGTMSVEEARFFDQTWKDAYNAVHDIDEVIVTAVKLHEQEYHHKEDTHSSLRTERFGDSLGALPWKSYKWYTNNWTALKVIIDGKCNLCNQDNSDATKNLPPLSASWMAMVAKPDKRADKTHREFEDLLCGMLRKGPFEYFHDLEDCDVLPMEDDPNNRTNLPMVTVESALEKMPKKDVHQAMVTVLVNTTGTMSVEEARFFDQTWKDAYNAVHDIDEVIVTAVKLHEQEYHHKEDTHSSLRTERFGDSLGALPWKSYKWYTNNWTALKVIIDGKCNLCNQDNSDATKNLPPLSASWMAMVAKPDKRADKTHRAFEDLLCGMLRKGPFEYFHDLEDCDVLPLEDHEAGTLRASYNRKRRW